MADFNSSPRFHYVPSLDLQLMGQIPDEDFQAIVPQFGDGRVLQSLDSVSFVNEMSSLVSINPEVA